MYETKKILNSQSNLEKKAKLEVSCSLFKIHYKAIVIKKYNTGTKQMKQIENPEINPHFYGQSVYHKGWKFSSINAVGKTKQPHIVTCKRKETATTISLYTKINSKCIMT